MGSALIVIDVQRQFFDPPSPAFEAAEVIARINALARRARAAGAPVIFVQHEQPAAGLTPDTPGWQLAVGLAAATGDLRVRKTTPDSFLRTDLEAQLQHSGAEDLVICGYASEFCVDTTVRRAAALGYAVRLAADAHTTDDKAHLGAKAIRAHHNATLPNIRSFGPRIQAVPAQAVDF